MAFYLTNTAALHGLRHLADSTSRMNTAIQRLSSGLRINSAKDDPAGLMISDRMTSEINGLYQASRNTSDAIALAQTAEGAMDEMTNMLQRMRTLAVQSANGTLSKDDRQAIQLEVDALSDEITRIAEQTTFAGSTILMGKDSTMFDKGQFTVQVGAYAGNTISFDFSQSFQLTLLASAAKVATAMFTTDGKLLMNTQTKASDAISAIDSILHTVNMQRAGLGALQTRFESAIRMQENTRANLSDARSRIRDTDYAEESANLFREQILQQSAVSMLMNARNRHGNMILQLLGAV